MNVQKFKHAFLNRLSGFEVFEQLMDLLPDVAFYVKDSKSRFVMSNQRHNEICRAASEFQVIGKTDYDFFPKDRADLYVAR
ncbi:MAG TPA: AraC family transcriptional regulator, partial [Candidatus Hydrogenedentes bacterium]|nr:AraC family transcriptional regulator [Candidatus Hydrogenedentota bacterium]